MRRAILILIFIRTSIARGGGGGCAARLFSFVLFSPSGPASAHSFSASKLNLVLTRRIPPDFRAASIYLCKPPYVIVGPVPSLSCHAIAYLLRSLPRVRGHRASSPQGSSSNGGCLFAVYHRPVNVRLSFPTPTIGMKCIINRGPPHSVFSLLYAAHILGSEIVCMYVYMFITYIWQEQGSTGYKVAKPARGQQKRKK